MSELRDRDPSLPRSTVLAVDDTYANLVALEALIKPLGHDVHSVSSGPEALELLKLNEYALILLDVMMPGMDGFLTLQALRQIPLAQKTPVIFLTARSFEQEATERAYALGAIDFLQKPISPPVLRAKIGAFVALYEQRQEIERKEAALRAKDHHLGVLAHDLRTPLSVIVASAARLEMHPDLVVQQAAMRIARATRRMQSLSDDLLEWARMAAGSVSLRREELDLASLCGELIDDFELVHPQVKFARDLPSSVCGAWDRARLGQAISNLLTNAVKYGTGWARLEVRVLADRVRLAVCNQSSAIADDQIEELFAPYAQGRERKPGVGLGLHIVRGIANAHAGSAYGHWCDGEIAFVIELPLDDALAHPPEEAADKPGRLADALAS